MSDQLKASERPIESDLSFVAWCRANGWSQERMAEECMSSRAHLNQVLTGKRIGRHTWRRLVKVLPMEALLLLQHSSAWNDFARDALAKRMESQLLTEMGMKCREPAEVAS